MAQPVLPETADEARRPWTSRLAACLAFAFLLLAAAAQGQAQPSNRPLTPVRFTLDWRFEGPAAPFLVALEKGYFREEGLDVRIDAGSGSREAIQRVASGAYDMGVGDINTLIRFRDEHPDVDVKAVMMIHSRPPFAIVGRKSRGITTDLSSLRGKKFGAPAADAAYAQWPIFKALHGIDEKEWNMHFENVGFPVREPMLAQGEVDAVIGFANSAYINLKSRNVPVEDIVVMNMSDYGLDLYGNAIVANPKFMAEHPEAVGGFLRAYLRGLKDTIANPEQAVDLVIRRNDVARREVELERLRMTLEQNMLTPEVKENGFGSVDRARLERAIGQIGLAYSFKNRPKAEDVFTDRFLPPEAERRLN